MSRRCELTGKGWQAGNKVSHANNKTRTRYAEPVSGELDERCDGSFLQPAHFCYRFEER